ncbi:MAG: response regulator [Synechococcaceae cyanobacterium SM2_3_60]|nr:response regulator [Synechococcaceae cyanobacterium SM2_3_60]
MSECRDGKEAIATLNSQAQRIDLVITDIEMPGQDGFGVLQQVRRQSEALPVFMLTSRAGTLHRDKAMSLGATAYFSKPFNAGELLSHVAQHTMALA